MVTISLHHLGRLQYPEIKKLLTSPDYFREVVLQAADWSHQIENNTHWHTVISKASVDQLLEIISDSELTPEMRVHATRTIDARSGEMDSERKFVMDDVTLAVCIDKMGKGYQVAENQEEKRTYLDVIITIAATRPRNFIAFDVFKPFLEAGLLDKEITFISLNALKEQAKIMGSESAQENILPLLERALNNAPTKRIKKSISKLIRFIKDMDSQKARLSLTSTGVLSASIADLIKINKRKGKHGPGPKQAPRRAKIG
jgi:hypothetical protein